MRRTLRRSENQHRLEMTPMIDVIFLLLTFFVYSMVMMIRADVLPVRLTPLATGRPARSEAVEALTVDKDGRLFLNREPLTFEQLDQRLAKLAADPNHARLYVAMELTGNTDRGPLLINLMERFRLAGINDYAIVGPSRPMPSRP